MSDPWLSILLADYEGHMDSENVQQLAPLAELFRITLSYIRPTSLAILGIAGGNGLQYLGHFTGRIVGVDVNQEYLDAVDERFSYLEGIELYRADLASEKLSIPPVDLVHAALVFEHAGFGCALDNAITLVADHGHLSVVLQLPSFTEQNVSVTAFSSIRSLSSHFNLIDRAAFCAKLQMHNFTLKHEQSQRTAGGKGLWLGIFKRQILEH
jgi:hypothetical protein